MVEATYPITDRDLDRLGAASGHMLLRQAPDRAVCTICRVAFVAGKIADTWTDAEGETTSRPPRCS